MVDQSETNRTEITRFDATSSRYCCVLSTTERLIEILPQKKRLQRSSYKRKRVHSIVRSYSNDTQLREIEDTKIDTSILVGAPSSRREGS